MNKKGVSLMISYVLLIGMVVTLSVVVGSWLYTQAQNPALGEEEDCEGVSISVLDITCSTNQVTATIINTGRFTIDKMYVKFDSIKSDTLGYDLRPIDLSGNVDSQDVEDSDSSSASGASDGLLPGGEMHYSNSVSSAAAIDIVYVKFIPYVGILCSDQIVYNCP